MGETLTMLINFAHKKSLIRNSNRDAAANLRKASLALDEYEPLQCQNMATLIMDIFMLINVIWSKETCACVFLT